MITVSKIYEKHNITNTEKLENHNYCIQIYENF